MSRAGRRHGGADTWRWPIALALLSVIGLVSALLGDGPWDVLSWIALGLPVVVIIWHAGLTGAPASIRASTQRRSPAPR